MNDEMLKNLSDMLGNTSSSSSSDNIKNIISNFTSKSNNNNSKETTNNFDFSNIDMDTIMKIQNIMKKMNSKKDDPRSNLLLSLKPYLKPSRKDKLDQYMKLINFTSIMDVFNSMGGESNK